MRDATSRFINVDELLPRITVEQVLAYYGVAAGELTRIGNEIRARCFLACGKTAETGDRALAIDASHPAKQWACHQYGCGRSGNLVSLCDLVKPGANMQGKPRGERFKAIAQDLQTMVTGLLAPQSDSSTTASPVPVAPAESREPAPIVNVPLKHSENERARALVNLDAKFLVDIATMSPRASSYFRTRPYLTPDVCRKWRMGYLPRDTGGDRSGGTMRGMIVYPLLSENGEVLTWFGRDPEFEEKHTRWEAVGKVDREPEKVHFVKGFHRGLELFGQHAARLNERGYREFIAVCGIVVVEGPNDVIALDCLGIPAVALCGNTITGEQAVKLGRWAVQLSDGRVTLMLDCDEFGERGRQQILPELSQHCFVRTAWSPSSHGGQFRGRQPESLTATEWDTIRRSLLCGAD